MLKKPMGLLLLSALTFAACKKDKADSDKAGNTEVKILGKWSLVSYHEVSFDASIPNTDINDYTVKPEDYTDIRSDKKVYSYISGNYDTTLYQVADGKYFLNSFIPDSGPAKYDTTNIETLTDTSLVLHRKADKGGGSYYELIRKFKR